ncbi:unnamed protein product [Ectocarpus sp. CCAP 1310/34]|nr:unnamed protein product [Ectocarpus sp. CCAP 1310/34]
MASSVAVASPSTSRSFVVIVAATAGSLGIGKNGALPWRLAADMAYFKRCTSTPTTSSGTITATTTTDKINAVIMGRKTWQSIPERFRPLAGRRNVVLSRNPAARDTLRLPKDVLLAGSLTEALDLLSPAAASEVDKVFVIGGGSVYAEAVASELCEKVLLTSVTPPADGRCDDCDTHFPALDPDTFKLVKKGEVQEEKGVEFSFDEYESVNHSEAAAAMAAAEGDKENAAAASVVGSKRKSSPGGDQIAATGVETPVAAAEGDGGGTADAAAAAGSASTAPAPQEEAEGGPGNEEEMQYLNLVEDILDNGFRRGDRTGTGTLSKFGVQMRFSLREERFPLLTTKRVFWRGVAEELLWFVAGCTNANVLKERGIHIWDGNGSREFLDGLGLTEREEGDLGPVYGFQWRHFGAEYTDMHADYTGKGVDQLAECITKIKTNPEDRRIVLSAWNPSDLGKMALPPCHMFCQFYVAEGELSCQMYQRSADMGLGVPFNIASYALLTRLVAQACGLKAGDFVHTIGDAHVYVNHVGALREQLKRKPRPFPTLSINTDETDIDSFEYKHLEVKGYSPYKTIKMKMAV